MKPIEFGDFLASRTCGTKAGGGASPCRSSSAAPKPGRGHRALGFAYKTGQDSGDLTQISTISDQESGFAADHVVELHGNTTYATCLECAKRYELSWFGAFHHLRRSFAGPVRLQRLLKTATVSFGQSMPEAPCGAPRN